MNHLDIPPYSPVIYPYPSQPIIYLDSFPTPYPCPRHSFHPLNAGSNRVGNLVSDNSLFTSIVSFPIAGTININLLFLH